MTTPSVELLAPAGSFDILRTAVDAGADAVYVSGKRFGARAYAPNFTENELLEAIDYVHLRGCKLHLTVNTLMKEAETGDELRRYLTPLVEAGLDALIIQDLGVLRSVRRWFPDLPLHASTQMSITSREGAALLQRAGVSRVIPARELSLDEITAVASLPGMEVEAFIHGALCYAYSGKCLFSSTMGERSGNRGTCAQPCRLPYRTGAMKRPRCLLSMQDLCAAGHLHDLINAGVCSLKIEGRMKDADYVAAVTSLYRRVLDDCLRGSGTGTAPEVIRGASAYARSVSGPAYLVHRNGPGMITDADASYRAGGAKSGVPISAEHPGVKALPVTASLKMKRGEPAVLTLSCQGETVSVCSGETVQAAQRAPLEPKSVQRRMEKTGEWPFSPRWQAFVVEPDSFLAVAQMNAMRREAYAQLAHKLLEPYRRTVDRTDRLTQNDSPGYNELPAYGTDSGIHALGSTQEQIEALLAEPLVSRIYVESPLLGSCLKNRWPERAHRASVPKQLFLALPHIFRPQGDPDFIPELFTAEQTIAGMFDGILVRALDELAWIRANGIQVTVCSDYLLYTFNSHSLKALGEMGVSGVCYSPEMSRHDIAAVEKASSGQARPAREILVYGRQIRMLSAQCVLKNTQGCSHRPHTLSLTDRRGVKFDVQNRCESCYNILYNSVPVSLHHQLETIGQWSGVSLRMDFTGESAGQVHDVLDLFTGGERDSCHYEYTKGHFERGIL